MTIRDTLEPPLSLRALPFPSGDALAAGDEPRHLRDYLRILYTHRTLALRVFAAVVVLTGLVVLCYPRRYTAATRLEVARRAPIQLGLKGNVHRADDDEDGRADPGIFVATQIAALQSRDLAERVLRTRRLADNDAFLRPAAGQRDLFAHAGAVPETLLPRGWDVTPHDDAGGEPTAPVDPELLDRYMRYLSVRDVRGTDLIEVGFTTPSPALSAFLAAAHTEAYLDADRESRQATDRVAQRFLARQQRDARRRLEAARAALDRFARAHPRVASDQEQKVLGARVTDLAALLTKAEGQRTTLESRYAFLTRPGADPLSYFLDRPGIEKLRMTLLDVRAQRATLAPRLGPNHPQMLELAQLDAEVRKQLGAEVTQAVAAARAQYDAARLRESRLRRKLARQEQAGVELRRQGTDYALLRGEVEAAQALYTRLLKQRTETGVSAELIAPNVRVIERAEVPHRPSRPKIPLLLTAGLLAACLAAVGAAIGRDYFDNSVRSSEDVEGLLHLPTLATIPNFALARRAVPPTALPLPARLEPGAATNGDGAGHLLAPASELLVLHEPWSAVAEAFRGMRTAVLFSVPGHTPKLLLVTSARAAEGKTVASVNLAGTLAESGARVLLVDADLRHPRCHVALGADNGPGLAGVLLGETDLDDAIRPAGVPGLFLLPAGPPPAKPAELVTSARMRDTLQLLRDRFDFVVLDTPPVLPVTDAVVLAREADGVVLVVKGLDTPRELVRRARDRLVMAGATFLGVMVNNVGDGWTDPYFTDLYYGRRPRREQRA